MKRRLVAERLWVILLALGPGALTAWSQLEPLRGYAGVNRDIPVRVQSPTASEQLELRLLEPRTWRTIEKSRSRAGEIDLAEVFPVLWTAPEPRMVLVQLYVDDQAIGAPVVLAPLTSPPTVRDELSARLRDALNSTDPAAALNAMAQLARTQRDAIAGDARATPAAKSVMSGFRVFVEKRVILETSEGQIELSLRHDLAPNTCRHFQDLVEGGFYDGVIFHRVVGTPPGAPESQRGFIIQSGDPTGTGEGSAGETINLEASTLEHDAGVVSMARRDDDPNSASSQFFICLSREQCASLDGRSAAFAEVTQGMEVVKAIASTPVGPRDVEDPLSPRDRPLVPPTIRRATAVPAPPAGTLPREQEQPPPVDR